MQLRTFTFWTSEPPKLNLFNGTPYGAETTLLNDKYLTRLRFETPQYLSKMQSLLPNATFEPPLKWKELSHQAYFKHDGNFVEKENYWRSGTLPPTQSLLELEKKRKLTKSDVLEKLKEVCCIANSKWDWTNISHQSTLLNEYLPNYLTEFVPQIIKSMNTIYDLYLASTLKEPKERFCILINGNSGTHKSRLAKMIVEVMAENQLIVNKHSFQNWKQQDLSDKLPRLEGKEVVLLHDYDGDNHKFGAFDTLTSCDVSKLRIMGDHGTNRFLKGAIFPTVDRIETWITNKTNTLSKFMQIVRRTHCTLHIFKFNPIPYGTPATWNDFDGRVFYIGDIQEWVYNTILTAVPNLAHKPLHLGSQDTQLALSLNLLMHRVLNDLFNDKTMWNGYYDRNQIGSDFWEYQPETKLWTKPNIIRTFKIPTYEWLQQRVKELDNREFKLPFTPEQSKQLAKNKTFIPEPTLEDDIAFIDTETAPAKDSFLKHLQLRMIQVNDLEYSATPENQIKIEKLLKGRKLVAYNAPFDQTQLKHAGYKLEQHQWQDIALTARLHDNRLAEQRVESLADMETELLGTTTKKDCITKLIAAYGKNYFHYPGIENEPLFKEYAINDNRVTRGLYDYLQPQIENPKLHDFIQNLSTKLAYWQAKGIPFPRDRITKIKDILTDLKQQSQNQQIDITLGAKTKASLKGWSSSKLKTNYIKQYKPEWLPYLDKTKTGIKFDNKAKETLIKIFPNDMVLQRAYDLAKKERVLQQLTKLLCYADKDILRPNYNFLGTASGRFNTREPEIHNLVNSPPKTLFLLNDKPEYYNVRKLLFEAPNVFEIDFANQEDRMSAKLSNEPKDIEAFIDTTKKRDLHQEFADALNVTRDQGKMARHGLRYGMQVIGLAKRLGIDIAEAHRIYNEYRHKYNATFNFAESLQYMSEVKSPILGRRIQFSEFKKNNRMSWTIQGSCVDLLLIALDYILDNSDKVELRGHFHDSVYLACKCNQPHPNCQASKEFVTSIEALYKDFTWPDTEIPVFKFGEIEWTQKGGEG